MTLIDPLHGSIIQTQNSRSPGLRVDWPGSELNTIASVENFSTEDFSSPENVFLEVADLQKTKSSFFNRLTTTTTKNKNVVHCPH